MCKPEMSCATFIGTVPNLDMTSSARHLGQLPAKLIRRWFIEPVSARPDPAITFMDKGHTLWIGHPLARQITCKSGTLWLTFDGEPHDIILEAGQSYRCAFKSRLGIHAIVAASVRIHPS